MIGVTRLGGVRPEVPVGFPHLLLVEAPTSHRTVTTCFMSKGNMRALGSFLAAGKAELGLLALKELLS